MNPLLNPYTSYKLLRELLVNNRRLYNLESKKTKRYIDNSFKKLIKYAYTIPMYHDKYKKAGVHPSDIKGIKDIEKIPFISKKELVDNYPDGIIPNNYNKNQGFVICTGGTTGKPVSLYTDFLTMGLSASVTIRELKYFKLNWRKSKIVHIGNFNQYRIDKISEENFQSHVKKVFSLKNVVNMDVNTPIIELVNTLDKIRPDIIICYPGVYQHMAHVMRKGYGKNIKPKLMWIGGAILDNYTREYVESAFGCKLLNIYNSVEAGTEIAFECRKGTWHINSDYFKIEAINDNNEIVQNGERGHIVITKLLANGTPIIRYTGMDDWLRINPSKKCECGITSPEIIGGVEGRRRANIVLPNGKVFPPGAFCFITPVLHKLNTFKVKQYQIVQKTIDEIYILLVIDEDERNIGPSFEEIAKNIKKIYQQKVGPEVTITVKEVKEIKHDKDASKPAPIVVSHVSRKKGYDTLESKT